MKMMQMMQNKQKNGKLYFVNIKLQIKMKNHNYIVIMAGGSGTRLWPISRKEHPKQFQRLTSEKQTLLQETYERVCPLADLDKIFISTTQQYAKLVKEQLPKLPDENIIIEPCGRDTAPAMGLVAFAIYKKDKDAIITTTPSDHAIKNPKNYICTVQTALSVIEDHPERFGLIGINPTEPSTELGYIQLGDEINGKYKNRVFEAMAFKEKPDAKTAKEYLSHWSYLWNAAYFVFKASTFIDMLKTHTPHILNALEEMNDAADEKQHEIYKSLPREPIDTVLLEKLSAKERFVVPADLVWSDVGNWRTLHDFYQNGEKNVVRGKVQKSNTENCLLFGNTSKVITTIGLKDIVIIDTEDAILIAHRDEVHNVKKIIDKLKEDDMEDLL
ncbi:MAG: sugar phosphate nucleotidyltransferase [Patescibacteria group bacterium]|nr:sugar phosphate nucleotidyltransferase [Patescibacteria group bacterium]